MTADLSHPDCDGDDHTCAVPSGRICIETGCQNEAGTPWGPYWCPRHDRERLDRISAQLDALQRGTGAIQ